MRTLFAAALLALSGAGHAAVYTLHADVAAWQAAAGPSLLQDFSGYTLDDSVQGATVLPGVTVSSNLDRLRVINSAELKIFASGNNATASRELGNAAYTIDLGNTYRAFAMDLLDFESIVSDVSGAVTGGTLSVDFADGMALDLIVDPEDDGRDLFLGLTADTAITRVRWLEGRESSGGNEETSLDNLRVGGVVNGVPEPSSLLLAAGALAVLARRRARAVP